MANFDEIARRMDVAVTSFGGLNRLGPLCGGKDCFELVNLRPMADGTLLRREGYRPLWSFDEPIREIFAVERNGAREVYILAGATIYATDGENEPCAIGTVASDTAKVRFACLDGEVLLFDGSDIRVLSPYMTMPLVAYIPLYGKDWEYSGGERPVWEKPNLLSNRIRISVRLYGGTIKIYLEDLKPLSVDAVIIGGRELARSGWEYDKYNRICTLAQTCQEGERVDLVLTMPESFFGARDSLYGATEAAVVGDVENASILLYGGTIPNGRAYMTRKTEEVERAAVRVAYPDSCPMMYVTADDLLTIGDGIQPIMGACQYYDRTLVFTPYGTWMTDGTLSESGKVRLHPINTTQGCTVKNGCVTVDNNPYTVFGRRVLFWNGRAGERDECESEVISAKVEPLFGRVFGQNTKLLANPWRQEIYLVDPDAEDGRMFVYSVGSGVWTSFDGFSPQGMILLGERLAFFSDRTVFVFDEERTVDMHGDGSEHPIRARYVSHYLDFGHAGRQRRVYGASVTAECESAVLTLHDVRGRTVERTLKGDDGLLSVMQVRGLGGRFRFIRAGIECTDACRFHLHGVRLTVGP